MSNAEGQPSLNIGNQSINQSINQLINQPRISIRPYLTVTQIANKSMYL